MPQVVDATALLQPEKIWASFALSGASLAFRDVSFKELAHAVDFVSWWIEDLIGRSTVFETIAYMGINDIRYGIMLLAAIKCGYKVHTQSVKVSKVRLSSRILLRSC